MSIDMKISWRNIWRNTRRSIITMAAICFSALLLIFMFSFQFGSYETMVNSSVKRGTGHIQILRKGYHENRDIHKVIENPGVLKKILDDVPEIDAFTFRGEAFSLASSKERSYAAMVIGIDPDHEAEVSTVNKLIRSGDFLSSNDKNDNALVGIRLSDNMKIQTGDEVTLLGQGRDGSIAATVVRIKGVFRSGIDEMDRSVIYMKLDSFQDVFFMGDAVHRIVINVQRLDQVETVRSKLKSAVSDPKKSNNLEILSWKELQPGLPQSIKLDMISGVIWYILLVMVVAFSIMNTFLMAVFERKREFGVMLALGIKPGKLIKILLLESMTLTGMGILAGVVLGCVLTFYFQQRGIDLGGASRVMEQFGISGKLYPQLSVLSVFTGPIAVLVITFCSALYPALKVLKIDMVKALSHE